MYDGLKILESIPDCISLKICKGKKLDTISEPVDCVVFGLFEDEAQLEAFKAHPTYAESIARVRPLRDRRVVADFYLEGDD